jgi:diaminohydroxyphosphoribosylaminopyrimidine deaminase / 5-amino-6-(5-phosphoribosylamino)uracil reductase
MQRCMELALRGSGFTAPNPMVGCVVVHNNTIISEGWHEKVGENHAERAALLKLTGDPRLKESTLYVNLEPCAHHGRTPPCSDLIAEYGIKKVVYGCTDIFDAVNGKGIEKLKSNNIEVSGPVLEKECQHLNRRFLQFHAKKRPYIVLKWAISSDGFMAPLTKERTQISGHAARILLHKWRSEESAVLVGSGTLISDKPELNIRYWKGKQPLRVLFDPELKGLDNVALNTLVFNRVKSGVEGHHEYILCQENNFIASMLDTLYERKVLSILVEGGASTLQNFLSENLWDEVRIIESKDKKLDAGISGPIIDSKVDETIELAEDNVLIYYHP